MEHPFARIPHGQLRRWQLPLFAIAAVSLAGVLGLVLPQREGFDLLELVEASDADRVVAVLAGWSAEDRVRVAYAVGVDFLVNPVYMSVLALGCVWSGRRFGTPRSRAAGSAFAWFAWSVILTNTVENIGLFRFLVLAPGEPWPALVSGAHLWATTIIVLTATFSLAGFAGRGRAA